MCRNYAEAAQKLKSRTSSSSNAQIKKAGAGPPLITSLRIRNFFGDFNPFKNKKVRAHLRYMDTSASVC